MSVVCARDATKWWVIDRNGSGGWRRVYKTPWPGDPRANVQDDNGMAKAYMVRIPPDQHRRLALEAAEAGVSLNRLASAKLS